MLQVSDTLFVWGCVYFIYLLAAPHGMWDLSSPTRDRTRTPYIGNMES